jgi:hypothetical protein
MYTMKDGNFIDVIPIDDLLVCYVLDGLLLYDISDPGKITKLGNLNY